MNIADFKERLKAIKEVNNFGNKIINIITPNGEVKGAKIKTSHTLIYTELNKDIRRNLSPALQTQALKMLNWRDVKADYYIWFDSDIFLRSSGAIDWMVNNIIAMPHVANFFKCHERNSIVEEANFICSELGSTHHLCTEVKSQVAAYRKDQTFDDLSMYLSSAFIFKRELVEEEGFNLMLDWFLETTSRSGVEEISLPYLLHKHGIDFGLFDECIMTNTYIGSERYYETAATELPKSITTNETPKNLVVEKLLQIKNANKKVRDEPKTITIDAD